MPMEFNLHSGKYSDAGVNNRYTEKGQIALPQGISGTTSREELDIALWL